MVVGQNTKTWRLLTYVNGKAKTVKLGRYPLLSLKDARQKARDFADDPRKFFSKPNLYPTASKPSPRTGSNVTLTRGSGLRSKPEIERVLNKYIYPQGGLIARGSWYSPR